MIYQLTSLIKTGFNPLGEKLAKGQIAVIPTDTIYGIVGSATTPSVVEKIYRLRHRSADKPMIILISDIKQLQSFQIKLSNSQTETLKKFWPNPVSIIIPCLDPELKYLHRGKNSLAFRLPKSDWLQSLIKISGPLVAPSANFEGQPPAKSITDAKKYFSSLVNFYIDGGSLHGSPSTVIELTEKSYKLIRSGIFKLHA